MELENLIIRIPGMQDAHSLPVSVYAFCMCVAILFIPIRYLESS